MTIKNFKINQNAASKLIAYVLIGAIVITSLKEHNNNKRQFKGTILEGATVITLDNGSKDIVVAKGSAGYDPSCSHYRSIISGIYIAPTTCVNKYDGLGHKLHHYGIISEENITSYLTSDELTKAMQGELDDNDISIIISRIIGETKTKTR